MEFSPNAKKILLRFLDKSVSETGIRSAVLAIDDEINNCHPTLETILQSIDTCKAHLVRFALSSNENFATFIKLFPRTCYVDHLFYLSTADKEES